MAKTELKNSEKVNPFIEARRYVTNADELLQKAGKDGNYYTDKKYIRMAGHTLWSGVLLSLEAITGVKTTKKNRINIKDYIDGVHEIDKKMTVYLTTAYDILHLSMSYDGVLSYKIVQEGKRQANYMIDWAEKIYKQRNK